MEINFWQIILEKYQKFSDIGLKLRDSEPTTYLADGWRGGELTASLCFGAERR